MEGELLRFGPFELDPERMDLRRSGLALRLPPQPLRILLMLATRAGEVVSREEIHRDIWGEAHHVDFEHGISTAIRRIRFALGDNAEAPRYVRTLPRVGYSFIAPVERVARPGPIDEAAAPAPRRTRFPLRWPAALIVAVTLLIPFAAPLGGSGGGRTVAVQPFRWIGPARTGLDAGSFAEELRARIGTLPTRRIRLLDRDSRADVVVEGTVRGHEGYVRVIVSIVDAASQTRVWSETIDRPVDRTEAVPIEVAHRVTQELARRFLPPPRHEPVVTTNVSQQALASYQLGREARLRGQWPRSKTLYETALREEPRFAEAWSGLSEAWVDQALSGPVAGRTQAAIEARKYAARALELQPRNAEAISTYGLLAAQRDYDLAAAEDFFRRATVADPDYVDAHGSLASVLAMLGQVEPSLRELEVARQLDPASFALQLKEPLFHLFARRFDDARARYRDILLVRPNNPPAMWGTLFTSIAQKRWSEAGAAVRMIRRASPERAPATAAEFLEIYRELAPQVEENRRRGTMEDYVAALYYAQSEDRDRAFALLSSAVDSRLPLVSYMRVDPRLDPLRGDARFRELLFRARLVR